MDGGVLLFSVLLEKEMLVFLRPKEATDDGVEEGYPR
jgi:hypothetical protein